MLCLAALSACASTHEAEEHDWSDDLGLVPLYSAYDGVHEYKLTPFIPSAALSSEVADPIDGSSVRWQVDASYVKRTGFADLPGSLLLTTKRAGETQLRVEATTRSGELRRGTALLTISLAKPEEWEAGEERFSVGFPLMISHPAMLESDPNALGVCDLPRDLWPPIPKTSACAYCHAPGASIGRPATPTQTAHYSDQQLLELVCMGAEPPSDLFESPYLQKVPNPACLFSAMHTWELSEIEHRGIIWKLRSIEPEAH
jgi:hypothetical protein